MEMDSDIIIEIRELSDKMESLRRFILDAPYTKDIEEKMDLELRLKKAIMEKDTLLFRVETKDNQIEGLANQLKIRDEAFMTFRNKMYDNQIELEERIKELVDENAELTVRYQNLYDTLEGSDDPGVA